MQLQASCVLSTDATQGLWEESPIPSLGGPSGVLTVWPCEDGNMGSHWIFLACTGSSGASFHGICLKILCLAGLPFLVLQLQRTGFLCVCFLCPPCSNCQLHQLQVWEQARHSLTAMLSSALRSLAGLPFSLHLSSKICFMLNF